MSESQKPDWATRKPNVKDVFEAGRRSPMLNTVLQQWQRGMFGTWEETMQSAVVYLEQQNFELNNQLIRLTQEKERG